MRTIYILEPCFECLQLFAVLSVIPAMNLNSLSKLLDNIDSVAKESFVAEGPAVGKPPHAATNKSSVSAPTIYKSTLTCTLVSDRW